MHELKKKLLHFFEQSNINMHAFEKKAGLGKGVIQAILGDKSKNPTIENIIKIANGLDCSIDELYGRKDFLKKYSEQEKSKLKYDELLFQSTCSCIQSYIKENAINNVELGKLLYLIQEIYEYSMLKNDNKIDNKFAFWLLKNQL